MYMYMYMYMHMYMDMYMYMSIYTYIILYMYSYDMPQVSLRLCDLLAPGGTLRATCHRHLASLGIGNQGEMLAEKWLWKVIRNL